MLQSSPLIFFVHILLSLFSAVCFAKYKALAVESHLEIVEFSKFPVFLEPSEEDKKWIEEDAKHLFFLNLSGKTIKDCVIRFEGTEIPLKKGAAYSFKIALPIKFSEHRVEIVADKEIIEYRFGTYWKKLPPSFRVKLKESDGRIVYLSTGEKEKIIPAAYAQLYVDSLAVGKTELKKLQSSNPEIKFFIPLSEINSIESWVFRIKDAQGLAVYELRKPVAKFDTLNLSALQLGISKASRYQYQLDLNIGGKIYAGTPSILEVVDTPLPPLKDYIRASLGLSSVSFTQTNIPDYSSLTTTAKLAYSKLVLPNYHLDAGGNLFLNLVPLSTSPEGVVVRFAGINFRVGYQFPQLLDPWSASLHLGIYYSTMFVSNAAFGYKNLIFPQIFPSVRRKLSDRYSVGAYFKFAPLGSELTSFNFSEREIAFGVNGQKILANQHPLFLELDFSDLTLKSPKSDFHAQSFSLSIGYGF